MPQTGVEECDDGNGNDQDDCSNGCLINGAGVSRLALGFNHSCAVRLRDRVLRCWGDNRWGQLGIGSNIFNRPTPNTTVNLTSVPRSPPAGTTPARSKTMGSCTAGAATKRAARRWSGS